MPSTCTFEFDRPEPVYYSGETVNGRIVLHTTSPKNVRDVSIFFEGIAKVCWEETRSHYKNGKTSDYPEQYRAEEVYISNKTFICGTGILPPGTHDYNFSIQLPPGCPSSCIEKYGTISYQIKLNLNRPHNYDNNFVQPMTVLHQNDLNLNSLYLWPVKTEDIKYFCCWPCSSGPAISTLTIPLSGYAPGQDIPFKLQIDNQSGKYDMESIKAKLIQTFTFTAHTPEHKRRSHSNILASIEKNDRCYRLTKRIIEGKLRIPAVPPTTQGSCIVDVAYKIDLTIETSGWNINPELTVPITIGTIPLWQSATQPDSARCIEPTAPDAPDTPGTSSAPPGYDFCKPPSYEEAVGFGEHFVDPDADPNIRQIGWVPKYPMYTNFELPSSYQSRTQNNLEAEQTKSTESRPLLNAIPSAPSAPQENTVLPYPIVNLMPGMENLNK